MKTTILSILSVLLLIECKGQDENENHNKAVNMTSIESVLKKQLLQGTHPFFDDGAGGGIEITTTTFNVEELDAAAEIADNILQSNNYKRPTDADFKIKIKIIFNRMIDFNTSKKYLYLNYLDKCDKTLVQNTNNGIDFNGLYIVKNGNFITDFYKIPELIDYQKKYQTLSKTEDALPNFYIDKGAKIVITKWKDIPSLSQTRSKNTLILANRNKYLFNSDKASFAWLKLHDGNFLESLVKIFGYVKDKELLQFVLKNNFKDKEALNSILWNQKCDGTAQVNKEVFDLVKTWSPQDLSVFSHNVLEVMLNLLKEIPEEKSANFSQKTRVLSLLAYYATKTDPNKYYSFFPILNDPDFDAEFKKASYYNISDFKEIYEETRYGGIGPAE